MDEYIKKEDVLKIIYDIKENKDIPKNYGTLIDIIQQIRNLPSEKVIELSEIEEFAETLKEKSKYAKQIPAGEYFEAVDVEDINNLVKERKGEK